MKKNNFYRPSLTFFFIIFLCAVGILTSREVSAGTKKIGEACNTGAAPSECIDGATCDDSFCTCGESSTPSASCAATYGNSSLDADKWTCIKEEYDPDQFRDEWNFCKKNDFSSSYPPQSTDEVRYPVAQKALLGFPCDDDDGCWDPAGESGSCQQTTLASSQVPSDPYYDPWYTSGKKLKICGAVRLGGVVNVQLQCAHQYGSGSWTAADGGNELAGIRVCQKAGGVIMSTLAEMRKITGPAQNNTTSGGTQTDFFGIDVTLPEVKLVSPATKIRIPGVVFSSISKESNITTDESGAAWLNVPFLGEYISAIYKYSVGLISFIAVLVLIISGIQIITSAGNTEAISGAKHRIVSSVIAIALTAGSYTILYTINPELVNLKNLKIMVLPTKQLGLKPEFDSITEAPDAPGPQNVQVFEQSNKLIPSDLPKKVNPIPYLIGTLPSTIKPCSQQAFIYTAENLTKQNICVGSCHCAYTASHFLTYAGCTIAYDGDVKSLVKNALSQGWTEVDITKDNVKNLPIGLTWQDGHVGVSIGSGKVFDSSSVLFNKINEATGGTCPPPNPLNKTRFSDKGLPTIFDIVPNDNQKNCSGCSKIPSEAPATGRFASPNGEAAKKYPNSLMLGTVSGGHGTCESIQVWGTRAAVFNDFKKVYTPPNTQ